MKTRNPSLAAGLAVLAAFGIQGVGYMISWDIGDFGVIAGIVLTGFASWAIGSRFPRRLAAIAVIGGGAFGFAYWYLNWMFLRVLRVDMLHHFNDASFMSYSAIYGLFLWPAVALCAIAAGVSSWRATGS